MTPLWLRRWVIVAAVTALALPSLSAFAQDGKPADKAAKKDDDDDEKDAPKFGSDRSKSPKKNAPAAEDKEASKARLNIEKKLGKTKNTVYLIETRENKYRAADDTDPKYLIQNGFFVMEDMQYKVIEGRETVVEFLLAFEEKYPKPDPKEAKRRKKKGEENVGPPPPEGHWDVLGSYKDNKAAYDVCEAKKAEYKAKIEQLKKSK